MSGLRRNRTMQKATAVPPHPTDTSEGLLLTREMIESYLTTYEAQGYSEETVRGYRHKLKKLYDDLPADKIIYRGSMDRWREQLAEEGYAPSSVNGFLAASNTFLEFIGHREYQAAAKIPAKNVPQPELTRTEYLRLLQAAKLLGKETSYLLVKLFATTPLPVQELHLLTVETAKAGSVTVGKSIIHLPRYLQSELLNYAQRMGRLSGSIFVTKVGTPINRTYVSVLIRQLCPAAQVAEEKGNPRCLRKLYQTTLSTIEANVALLVEQAMERQLEMEQMTVGWENAPST